MHAPGRQVPWSQVCCHRAEHAWLTIAAASSMRMESETWRRTKDSMLIATGVAVMRECAELQHGFVRIR